MTTIRNFDTHEYVKGAIEAGYTQEQAEFNVTYLAQALNNQPLTKADLHSILDEKLNSLKYELTLKMYQICGAMIFAAIILLCNLDNVKKILHVGS